MSHQSLECSNSTCPWSCRTIMWWAYQIRYPPCYPFRSPLERSRWMLNLPLPWPWQILFVLLWRCRSFKWRCLCYQSKLCELCHWLQARFWSHSRPNHFRSRADHHCGCIRPAWRPVYWRKGSFLFWPSKDYRPRPRQEHMLNRGWPQRRKRAR